MRVETGKIPLTVKPARSLEEMEGAGHQTDFRTVISQCSAPPANLRATITGAAGGLGRAIPAAFAAERKVLAIEWGSRGVRVNAGAPVHVHTALIGDLIARGRVDIEFLRKRAPLQRLGEPSEVAELCVFLSSQQSAFITGQIYGIDGGWSAYGFL